MYALRRFVSVLLICLAAPALAASLPVGAKAPVFTAPASLAGHDFDFSLAAALSRGPVVVYFYPAAYTGGCDLEAHTFAEHAEAFAKAGASIIGVSADSLERLNRFSADPDYCAGKFPVASDPQGAIAARYGLTMQASRKGVHDVNGDAISHGFLPRTTFVIDAEGHIVKVFSSRLDHIRPDQHVIRALAIVKRLSNPSAPRE